jgi:integrase
MLLSHGLLPREVRALRLEDLHVDVGVAVVRDARGLRPRWRVPLTDRAIEALRAYAGSLKRVGWLFPKRDGHGCASPALVRCAVATAARRAFPHTLQASKRRRITPIGFRHLFLRRVIRTRIDPAVIGDLTRFIHFSSVRRYVDPRIVLRQNVVRSAGEAAR